MRSRHCLAWGSVTALLAAAAFAQQPEANRRDGTQPTRPGTTSTPSRVTPMSGMNDPKEMMRALDGMYRVEMRINPEHFQMMKSMRHGEAGQHHDSMNNANRDASRTNTGANTGANTGTNTNANDRTTGANQPGGTNQNNTTGRNNGGNANNQTGTTGASQPGTQPATRTNNQPGTNTGMNASGNYTADLTGAMVVTGYCEKQWIMGGDVLQETCIIPDLGTATTFSGEQGAGAGNAARPNAAESDLDQPSLESMQAGNMWQTVTFLSLNEQNETFDYVSMCSIKGGIMHSTGNYDASSQAIEFNVTDVMGGGHDQMHDSMDGNSHLRHRDGATEPGMIDDPNARNQPGQPTPPSGDPANNQTGSSGANNPAQPNTGSQPRNTTPGGPNSDRAVQPDRGVDGRMTTGTSNTGTMNSGDRMYNIQNSMGENFTVVVEVISEDQHRVTMYQGQKQDWNSQGSMNQAPTHTPSTTSTTTTTTTTPGSGTGATPRNDGGATPGFQPVPNADNPNTQNPSADPAGGNTSATRPGQPSGTTGTTDTTTNTTTTYPITGQPGSVRAGNVGFQTAHGKIIWQAIYTRVDGAEASRYRQFMDRADQLMQAGVSDEIDDR